MGELISGSGKMIVENKPTSRLDVDKADVCNLCITPPITSGTGKMIVENKPTARMDDTVSCGCVITSGSGKFIIDNKADARVTDSVS